MKEGFAGRRVIFRSIRTEGFFSQLFKEGLMNRSFLEKRGVLCKMIIPRLTKRSRGQTLHPPEEFAEAEGIGKA